MRSEATEPHVDSYWLATAGAEPDGVVPLPGDRAVEVAVIGGGYTGLSAAYHLASAYGVEVLVLEANRIGWGASGRNGGICSTAVGKVPLVGTADDEPSVIYAMAYLGNGVSIATYCGGLAAALAAGKDVARGTPLTDASVARFPLPRLRRAYIAGAYLYYGLKDRWR